MRSDSVAIVDDDDFERLNVFRWHLGSAPTLEGAPVTIYRRKNFQHMHYMHHLVMNVPKGTRVANLSGDRLDCRKKNLQVTSQSLIMHSLNRLNVRNSTGYRGVSTFQNRGGPLQYRGRIQFQKKAYEQAGFLTPEAAHLWVLAKKRELIDEADLVKYTALVTP